MTSSSSNNSPPSLPQSCLVNGFKYQHGQQIDRYRDDVNNNNSNNEDEEDGDMEENEEDGDYDPCVYCLCIDGDMYCWWGDEQNHSCNLATFTANNGNSENKPTTTSSGISSQNNYGMTNISSVSEDSTITILDTSSSSSYSATGYSSSGSSSSAISSSSIIGSSSGDVTNNSTGTSNSGTQYTITTDNNVPSPSVPTVCVVMGREYYQGEVLPHETGTCLECQCGKEGRVTCSPKDCISQQDDEFHNPSDTNSLDMFDVDIF